METKVRLRSGRFGRPKLTLLRPPVVLTGRLSLMSLSASMVTCAAHASAETASTSGSIQRSSGGRPAPVQRSSSCAATAKRSSAVGGMPSSFMHRPTTGHLYFSTSGSTASMRGCSPLMELMKGTLPPLSMTARTPASSACGPAESTMSWVSVTLITVSMSQVMSATSSPPATPPLTSSTDAPAVDLLQGEGLDELRVAGLDRLADLLARPVDRFTHQEHRQRPPHSVVGTNVLLGVYAKAVGVRNDSARGARPRRRSVLSPAERRATARTRDAHRAAAAPAAAQPSGAARRRAGRRRRVRLPPGIETPEQLGETLPRGAGDDEKRHRFVDRRDHTHYVPDEGAVCLRWQTDGIRRETSLRSLTPRRATTRVVWDGRHRCRTFGGTER